MNTMKTWKEKPAKLEEFKRLVENGEYFCAANPTRSARGMGAASDNTQGCQNTATHVKTITRTFAMFTQIVDIPLCDEHKSYYF